MDALTSIPKGVEDPLEDLPRFECPEKDLWAGVLLRAFKDLDNPELKRKIIFWFSSNRNHVGSFRWICTVLGLDGAWIKEQLKARKWKNPL